MDKIKLFIDTDMGGDVDDALALTAALRCESIRLLGVSTVYLRPEWRAQVVCNVIEQCGGAPVPVAAGCGNPLCGEWDERNIPDTGVLAENMYVLSGLHGSDLLLQCARDNPNMAILAIGPLTNLALALMKDREALADCPVYIMGGRVNNGRPEWNILCDPESANLVLNSGLKIYLVPFDVTMQSGFSQEEVDAVSGTAHRDFLRGMMNAFTRKFGFLPMMHDPMALAMLVRPEFFVFRKSRIAVELRGSLTRGTLVDYGADAEGNVMLAEACDQDAFRRWIKEKLMGPEKASNGRTK